MGLRNKLASAAAAGHVVSWFVAALCGSPLLIALGFWLLGVSLDWSSWKTYAGLVVLSGASLLANR